MLFPEFSKSMVYNLADLVGYQAGQIISKRISEKLTGDITVFAFAKGESTFSSISAFDTFIQVIDGTASAQMNDRSVELKLGQVLIIPAHTLNKFTSKVEFKMISTVFKT